MAKRPLPLNETHYFGARGFSSLNRKTISTAVPNHCIRPFSTTRTEQALLFLPSVLIPLQEHIPDIGGFSMMWFVIAGVAGYVLLNRPQALSRTWLHPVFRAAFVLVCVASLVEFLHPHASYSEILSLGSMFIGAIFLAALCRDTPALRAAVYGFIMAGLWLSALVFMTSYGVLSAASASNFLEASRVRDQLLTEIPLEANANVMAAQIAQGLVAALALALTATSRFPRYLLLTITMCCTVAVFLPMSRGGIAIAILSSAAVLYAFGIKQAKTLLIAGMLSASILMVVPNAVWSRLTPSDISIELGKEDPREAVYAAALEKLPKYIITGVGGGNFWESWGYLNGFNYKSGTIGSHNSFFQVTIYWGLPGLFGVLAVIWQAYRCFPKGRRRDGLALSLVGISVALLLVMMVRHVFYAKEFAIALGLFVGAHIWIWPSDIRRTGNRPGTVFSGQNYVS
jgi:hypothetical protein